MSKKQISRNTTSIPLPEDSKAMAKLKIYLGIIIGISAFVLYAQSISFEYVLDDGANFEQNKIITQGISAIPTILTKDYWYGLPQELRVAEYRPVPSMIFAIEWQLFPNKPSFGHLINVLFYAFTCWLLFYILCMLFENKNLLFPFICSLLFALHPIHTEVVDNIKSLDEILCLLFALLTLLFAMKYSKTNSWIHLFPLSICFLLSLLSKENSISFLVLIPLFLFVFTNTDLKKHIYIISSLLLMIGIYFFIRHKVLESFPAENYTSNFISNSLLASSDFIVQRATAFYILLRYLMLLIFPHPLSYDYSFSQIPMQSLSSPAALLAIVIYLVMGIYAILNIRKKSIVAVGILFFLISIAPVSNIFLLIASNMSDRFLFMPSLGFCIVLTYVLIKLTKSDTVKKKYNTVSQMISLHKNLYIIVFIIGGLYSIKTFSRSLDWKDNAALFSHDVKYVDKSARAHYNWGYNQSSVLYLKEKDETKKKIYLDKAIVELTKAYHILNTYPSVLKQLGYCYSLQNDYQNALKYYELARPSYSKNDAGYYNLIGLLYVKVKDYNIAINNLDTALRYNPKFAEAYNGKGVSYDGLGKAEEGIASFRKAVEIDPKYVLAYVNLANDLLNTNKNEESIKASEKAIEMDAKNADAYCYLGGAYSNLSNYEKAIKFLNKAIELDSTNTLAYKFLGVTYQKSGDMNKANLYYAKAAKTKTN